MKQLDNASSSSDAELIVAAKLGNQLAIETLLIKHKALVRKVARNYYMAGGGDSDDIVQEGTIGLLKAISTYQPQMGAAFSSYAHNCIANNIKDALRKVGSLQNKALNEALQSAEQEEAKFQTTQDKDVITLYVENEFKEKFYSLLSALITPEQMQIFKLYMEGYAYKEIAEKTGKTAKNIDNILAAIKIKIKKSEAKFASIQGE